MPIVDGIAYPERASEEMSVLAARLLGGRRMAVTFSTGETRVFDASPLLEFPAFAALVDDDAFADFSLDHGVITWLGGEVDISPAKVYQMSAGIDVVGVSVCGKLAVRAFFSDGSERVVDVAPLVARGGVFAKLADREFFEGRLAVMNGTVAWDVSGDGGETRCIDLDPVKIYEGGL